MRDSRSHQIHRSEHLKSRWDMKDRAVAHDAKKKKRLKIDKHVSHKCKDHMHVSTIIKTFLETHL